MKNILGIVFGINLTQESMPCLKKRQYNKSRQTRVLPNHIYNRQVDYIHTIYSKHKHNNCK